MEFEARVYFDVAGKDTWRFYRLLAAAAQAGASLSMEWMAFAARGAPDGDQLAAFAHVQEADPAKHGLFVQALLTLHHANGRPLGWDLVDAAAAVSGVDRSVVDVVRSGAGRVSVEKSTEEAVALGVTRTPTLFRHGPVLYVKTTPAVLQGDPIARLELIDRMLTDDGMWEMSKP